MRTATLAPLTAKVAWFFAALFFVAMLVAIAPNVLDALTRFGLIRSPVFVAPPAQIRTLAIPTYAPALVPVASPELPQAPLRENAAPAIVAPVGAPTVAPVAPVGIKVIVIKPADGSGPIVLRDGYKYRGRP